MLKTVSAIALSLALALPAMASVKSDRQEAAAPGAVKNLNEAVTLLQKGDEASAQQAIPLLTKAIDSGGLNDNNLQIAYFARGSAYRLVKQCPNAVPDLDKAIEMKKDPQAYAMRGDCKSQMGKTADAIADLKQAAALDPAQGQYVVVMCGVAFNAKLNAEAGPDCELAATKLDPVKDKKDLLQILQASAQSYEAIPNKPKANEIWKKLLAADPTSEAAKQGIARTGGKK